MGRQANTTLLKGVSSIRQKLFVRVLILSIPLSCTCIFSLAQDASLIEISGTVTDQLNKQPLADVSIQVKGTVTGTITNKDGAFKLRTKSRLPFTLTFSSVGFKEQQLEVNSLGANLEVALVTQTILGNEVVVTASRVQESLLKSPVAIEKLSLRAIKESPAPTFYDALENLKGVQLTTSSITFKIPNTRGFNIPNNFRFVQLNDGVDVQAATLGVPLGNSIGPSELDIESVEITPGAASALYGMNAINGLANLITKNPFKYQELSVYQRTGINHIGEGSAGQDAKILTESAVRYAKAFNNKFAFKINLSYLRGTDWRSDTRTDQNPNNLNTANPAYPELNGPENNPAYDAWNKYADDAGSNAVSISGITYKNTSNNTFLVRRTGYWEKDLVDPTVTNIKADAALHYRFSKNAELSYAYRFGQMDGIFQRGNKIQLDNLRVQNHKLELKGDNYLVRTYVSIENSGDSYNLKPLADNLDLTHRSNASWRDAFKSSLQSTLGADGNNSDLATAMRIARAAADAGREEPGTPGFDALKRTIIGINNWDHKNAVAGAPETGGAWLRQLSRTYHIDAQWDLTRYVKWFNLLVGGDLRIYEVIPDGNNFVDFSRPVAERNKPVVVDGKVPDSLDFGKNVYYKKYGGFVQGTKNFFDEKLKVSVSLRLDQNPEFSPKLNPRIALVYTAAQRHNFRVSFQNGFRFPAIFEAISFVNNGNVRRVGGLSYINEGLGYLDNSYTRSSVETFNAAVNADVRNGMTANAAALKNRDLLDVTALSETRPERINSFEAGYKSILLDNRLLLDFDAYINQYDGFLGQVEVYVPEADSVQVGTDRAVTDMLDANRSKQTRYRVYTNAKNKYTNYGAAFGVTYNFGKTFSISGNVNYNAISKNKQKDVFVTGFNTPEWFTNLSFGNREVVKNMGFNIVWRWQDAFYWEIPLANGNISAYNTIDAQVTYRIPSLYSTIKVGGSNVLNNRYIQYAAGPTIGALYYAAITVDGLLK
ncbi:MAG TPA: TonB-dependent receptor [Chitinophagaceae bacterium]|nr:TonB-dependent receptor [Chitinophagaceae bacterium]